MVWSMSGSPSPLMSMWVLVVLFSFICMLNPPLMLPLFRLNSVLLLLRLVVMELLLLLWMLLFSHFISGPKL